MLNVKTGQACVHAQFVSHAYGRHLIWLPDGQFVSLTSDPLQRGHPCRDDFVAIDRAGLMLPAAPDPSLSPGG